MELSQQFLIDLLFNIGGYLVAGALAGVVYSIFKSKRVTERTLERAYDIDSNGNSNLLENHLQNKHKVKFIKLGEQMSPVSKPDRKQADNNAGVALNRSSNRSEIIKIARRMLDAGASHEKIKMVLPVSEAELALLGFNKN